MAAENKNVNGYNGAHHTYTPGERSQGLNAQSGSAPVGSLDEEAATAPAATPSEPSAVNEGTKPPSKDEVGWYFVESYYTTLSKNPETLYLYYNKRSQFLSGVEAEKVDVSVGQNAINDRIKELGFQDCKVRVSNVDAQESFKNIVVQVIGEMSNKAAAHRKFVQTFVLAEQPKGYYVLNDIFRYIVDDEEEEMENGNPGLQEPVPTLAPDTEPETLTSSADPVQQQHAVEQVDKRLEEAVHQHPSADEEPADSDTLNGYTAPEAAEIVHAEDAPAAAMKESQEPAEAPKEAAENVAAEVAQEEKPRDPEPTPTASPPKPAKAAPIEPTVPAAPVKPAARKTWAMVAEKSAAAPAIPNGSPSSTATATPPPPQPKATPSTTNQSVTTPTSTGDESPAKAQQNGNFGWQMAGSDNNKKHGRQHSQSVSGGQEKIMAYVKNVTDKVDASILRTTLEKYENGKLPYFDVSRQKNCAFVEFSDEAAYKAAVKANPHMIGGEQVIVEARRPRANAYGGNFAGRGGMRGGRGGNENRPGSQGRGGYAKDGGRGGFPPHGRGGNLPQRGRGQPQAA